MVLTHHATHDPDAQLAIPRGVTGRRPTLPGVEALGETRNARQHSATVSAAFSAAIQADLTLGTPWRRCYRSADVERRTLARAMRETTSVSNSLR